MTAKQVARLRKTMEHRIGASTRKMASRFEISPPYVRKLMKKQGLKFRKRMKIPKSDERQQKTQKVRLLQMEKDLLQDLSPTIVMDDETYFTYQHNSLPENSGFYTMNVDTAPSTVKFKTKEKYPKRLLLWIAISKDGISKPYFLPTGTAVNAQVYSEKCIRGKLLSFLQEYHSDGDYIFWPDLASAHYAAQTLQTFNDLKIPFVSKEQNPPNCPQLRPIEDFFGVLKGHVYAGGWQAKSADALKRRIKNVLLTMNLSGMKRAMANLSAWWCSLTLALTCLLAKTIQNLFIG